MSSLENYKHLSPEAFAELDFKTVTLLDLREPDEVLISGIEGALNLPFSGGFGKLDSIPRDKPVVVFCRIVACQMSMDIMGIHKEELLDGVELGGVSTFLGSGEQSDMSLFI